MEVDKDKDFALAESECDQQLIPLSLLLDKDDSSIDAQDKWKQTALIRACGKNGNRDNAISLIKHGANLDLVDKWGNRALQLALDRLDQEEEGGSWSSVVELMLDRGVDWSAVTTKVYCEYTLFMYACYADPSTECVSVMAFLNHWAKLYAEQQHCLTISSSNDSSSNGNDKNSNSMFNKNETSVAGLYLGDSSSSSSSDNNTNYKECENYRKQKDIKLIIATDKNMNR